MRTLHFPRSVVLPVVMGAAATLTMGTATAVAECVPAPQGMIAWWPLGDASGAGSAVDIVGGYDADYLGTPVTVQGKVGNAVHLDGVEDCLSVADDPVWDFGTADFTFEFWVSFDTDGKGSPSNPGDVFLGHSEGPFNVDKYIFAFSPGQLQLITFNSASGLGAVAPVTPWVPGTGVWLHVALTRSGIDYSVYLNGSLADTEQNLATLPDVDATLLFGCIQEPWNGYHTGGFDEISVYDRALTAEEIAAIVAAGALGKCAPVPTTTSTSTTLPAQLCADVDDNAAVTAADALMVLKAAVGGPECDEAACVCDVDGNGKRTATDALAALKIAVGLPVPALCPC